MPDCALSEGDPCGARSGARCDDRVKGKGTEKHAAGLHEREEYDETEAFFRLLIECLGDRAGGYDCPGRQSRKREIPVSDSRKRD